MERNVGAEEEKIQSFMPGKALLLLDRIGVSGNRARVCW
jgi:hypothetical protein